MEKTSLEPLRFFVRRPSPDELTWFKVNPDIAGYASAIRKYNGGQKPQKSNQGGRHIVPDLHALKAVVCDESTPGVPVTPAVPVT